MASEGRRTNRDSTTGGGTVALGRSTDERLSGFVRGRRPAPLPAPDDPWPLMGSLYEGVVGDDRSHADALDAAVRGADVVVHVDSDRLPAIVEDLDRVGVALWHPAESAPGAADWAPLLDALAGGATTEEAARRCHLSVRSAHRRLAAARAVLGVSSTAAAVARWSTPTADT